MAAGIVRVERLEPGQLSAVRDLDRHGMLDDQAWLEVEALDGHALALDDAGAITGYAHLVPDENGWMLRLAVAEAATDAVEDLVAALGHAGESVTWFVRDVRDLHETVAARLALANTRELWQMRVPLPLDVPWDLDWRPFRPGVDEQAWIDVNNRAFATHPDQGRQTLESIRAQEEEPWFDPAGFLVHEEDGRMVGFCWTKVHADHDPPLGEIYVIGVDPSAHGRGLGQALVLAGLDWLHRAGLGTGMLYVESDNDPAVRLYRKLGFETAQRDVFFTGSL